MEKLEEKLLNKSVESFILGIEIYNKPTIKYRVEGFSFFICNAWELMLKSYIIKSLGEKTIYYKDNPDRTISLEKCIEKVFTNKKDPLRINIEKIIELRNTSTHFITEEYEMIYIPLFQACVINFSEKIKVFHDFDITKAIPQNFLTLSVSMEGLEDSKITAKYPEEIAKKLISKQNDIDELSYFQNDKFAIAIEHHHFITKDPSRATSIISISKDSDTDVKIIKELKNPNKTHPFTAKNCIKHISNQLEKDSINIDMHMSNFLLFIDYYDLKSKEEYCFVNTIGLKRYSYSMKTIDLIVSEIKIDPQNIIENLKKFMKAKKS